MGSVNEWFTAIYKKYYQQLVKTASYLTNDWVLAEDVVQNVFLTLLMKHEELRNHSNLPGWLIVTLKNQIMNELRRAHYSREVPFLPEHEPSAEDPASFMSVLPAGLEEEERLILYLYFEAGLSHKELGTHLGCSPDASRMRLHRVKNHCRNLLLGENSSD